MSAPPFSLKKIAVAAYGPSFLFGLGEGAILPMVPLTARDLGASVSIAALLVTLLGVGSLASNLPASMLTARYGERRAIVGAAIWGALAMLLCVVADSIWSFAIGVFMIGMAAAVFYLARLSFLTEAVPAHFRARALSTLGGVMRIGLFIGPFAAAGLIHFVGPAGAWWVGSGVLVLGAILALGMPELPGRVEPSGAVVTAPTLRSIARDHRSVFITVGIGISLISAVRASRQAIIPLWADHIGLDAATISLIYGLSNAVDMLVFYPAGKWMDSKGRRSVAVPSMIIMGVALLLMPFTTAATTLLVASLLVGFGNGIGSGLVMTLGADHSPARGRPQFLGVWRLLSDLGATGGPALLSAMTAVATLAAGIVATGVLAFAGGAMLWYWIPRTARPAAT